MWNYFITLLSTKITPSHSIFFRFFLIVWTCTHFQFQLTILLDRFYYLWVYLDFMVHLHIHLRTHFFALYIYVHLVVQLSVDKGSKVAHSWSCYVKSISCRVSRPQSAEKLAGFNPVRCWLSRSHPCRAVTWQGWEGKTKCTNTLSESDSWM